MPGRPYLIGPMLSSGPRLHDHPIRQRQTMKSYGTPFQFSSEFDRKVYADWHQPLLARLFGTSIDLHYDLYEATHRHRREHNRGADNGPCDAWPSPLYLAPLWSMLAEKGRAKRFLEVGTAIGYTAVLMADAGGPGSLVDTIEADPGHADRAEKEIIERGLSKRVHVLKGRRRQYPAYVAQIVRCCVCGCRPWQLSR